jgi:hypothetical protein
MHRYEQRFDKVHIFPFSATPFLAGRALGNTAESLASRRATQNTATQEEKGTISGSLASLW